MKHILVPIIAGVLFGLLVGFGLLWLEFGMVQESFINYLPN